MTDEHVYVISDLHLGAGPEDRLEDFHFDELLVAWLDDLDPGSTVVINGDFIDFAQIPPFDLGGLPRHLLWDEATSLVKLRVALDAHAKVFDALGGVIERRGAVILTVGNHDLDLAWSGVEAALRSRLGGPSADQFSVKIGAHEDRGLHVAHGYQFTPENCPRDPDRFIHPFEDGGETRYYLERVWGTDFVLRFFNDVEDEWPFIDNVKPTLRVLMAGLRGGWIPLEALARLAVFAKIRLPFRAAGSFMSEDAPPDELLLEAFAEEEWQELVTELRATRGDDLDAAVSALPPTDREVLRRTAPVALDAEPADPGAPQSTMGLFRPGTREQRSARAAIADGANVVVFGHTHHIVDGNVEGAPVPGLFNPGSWVPKLRLGEPEVAARVAKDGLTPKLLSTASLYRLEARAVHVVHTSTGPRASIEDISARYPELAKMPQRLLDR